MIQQTTIQAYEHVMPKLETRMFQVYDVINTYKGGISNREIAEILNLPINCVTGRTRDLVKLGLVEATHVKKDPKTCVNVLQWVAIR